MGNYSKTNIKEEKKLAGLGLGYASQAANYCSGFSAETAEELSPELSAGEKKVSDICGDTAVSCRLPDGSRAVILSDGMGHGHTAAADSRMAAGQLRRLLKQGMPVARAIKEVNRYLLEKESRRESYATVDLTIIDQSTGRAKFYKMAAAPSYIIRGRRIRKIQQSALPVGIVPTIRLTHVSARLAPGDIIVMMSDGICDSGCRCRGGGAGPGESYQEGFHQEESHSEEDWVLSYLADMTGKLPEGTPGPGPRQLANTLLAEARRRYGEDETDDATVAVLIIR